MNEKRYYNIVALAEDFDKWEDGKIANKQEITAAESLKWQSRFLLAIAQQLSMVAKHLGTIVKTAEEKKS